MVGVVVSGGFLFSLVGVVVRRVLVGVVVSGVFLFSFSLFLVVTECEYERE